MRKYDMVYHTYGQVLAHVFVVQLNTMKMFTKPMYGISIRLREQFSIN